MFGDVSTLCSASYSSQMEVLVIPSRAVVQHILAFIIGVSLFRALYGHDPNMGATPVLTETTNLSVTEMLEERATHTTLLRE